MRLPPPRGPLSGAVIEALRQRPTERVSLPPPGAASDEPWHDDDLQLALWVCYELHYRGFEEVDDRWEWNPALLWWRSGLERDWETALLPFAPFSVPPEPRDVPAALRQLIADSDGPPLATFLQREATRDQFREFLIHRSVYHLKEADPHSWALPRLDGRTKGALVEIQADEYGGGHPERIHAELFRVTMRELGLSDAYGAYVDETPAVMLAASNLMHLFGLHRRWLGATLGHLAAFEMTSTLPNRRIGGGLRRLGGSPEAVEYFDEHVEADAVHEQVAANDLCGSHALARPDAAGDVLFGAACYLRLEAEFGEFALSRWRQGASTLRSAPAVRQAAPAVTPS
ncbi:iron-containing redox enzyme family protein [Actinoalloteichus spitiensis]|uniref:iron-containing redox enzyme family protein n=1 Tax=Actinoalloteichus spitiensis TaxID=252394 RepID=UPI0003691C6A|nr:iron-containing redox enzyme family protein [Actinoalloteichus spitiensis]